MNQPLVSIITPVLNGEKTIAEAIKSILGQSYRNIEYIIVDNGSTDKTMEIVNSYKDKISKSIFEKEKGIYTTMNKGLKSASGEIIGILNCDDVYDHSAVIKTVVETMEEHGVDACWGDLVYIGKNNMEKIIRYWKSSEIPPERFTQGWMPAHPTFFVRRRIYEKYGFFNTDFRIAADYELMLRFLMKYQISNHYIPQVLIKMRMGGVSNRSLKNLLIKNYEDYQAWKINKLGGGLSAVILKNLIKIPQFFKRYKNETGI